MTPKKESNRKGNRSSLKTLLRRCMPVVRRQLLTRRPVVPPVVGSPGELPPLTVAFSSRRTGDAAAREMSPKRLVRTACLPPVTPPCPQHRQHRCGSQFDPECVISSRLRSSPWVTPVKLIRQTRMRSLDQTVQILQRKTYSGRSPV